MVEEQSTDYNDDLPIIPLKRPLKNTELSKTEIVARELENTPPSTQSQRDENRGNIVATLGNAFLASRLSGAARMESVKSKALAKLETQLDSEIPVETVLEIVKVLDNATSQDASRLLTGNAGVKGSKGGNGVSIFMNQSNSTANVGLTTGSLTAARDVLDAVDVLKEIARKQTDEQG
jgi:hypothetical protein